MVPENLLYNAAGATAAAVIFQTKKAQKPEQQIIALLSRGSERIRTAVRAFAELCLATRPRNLFLIRVQI